MAEENPTNRHLVVARLGKGNAPRDDIGLSVRDAAKRKLEAILRNIKGLRCWYVFTSRHGETLFYLVESPFDAPMLTELILTPDAFMIHRKDSDLRQPPVLGWDDSVLVIGVSTDCAGHRHTVENGHNILKLLAPVLEIG